MRGQVRFTLGTSGAQRPFWSPHRLPLWPSALLSAGTRPTAPRSASGSGDVCGDRLLDAREPGAAGYLPLESLRYGLSPSPFPKTSFRCGFFASHSSPPSLTLNHFAARFSVHFLPDSRPIFWRLTTQCDAQRRSQDGITGTPACRQPVTLRCWFVRVERLLSVATRRDLPHCIGAGSLARS